MTPIEISYRRAGRSGLASLLGAGMTVAIFGLLPSTRLQVKAPETEEAPILRFTYIPPAESTAEQPLALPSNQQPDFQLEFSVDVQAEDVPLDFLDIPGGAEGKPVFRAQYDWKAEMEVNRPALRETMRIFSRSEVDTPPVAEYLPHSSLPSHLERMGGELYVLYRVTDRGRTENIHVLSTPDPDFIPYAERYIRQIRFRPAYRDGKPVNMWVQHALIFHRGSGSPFQLN